MENFITDQVGEYSSRRYRWWKPKTDPWSHLDNHLAFPGRVVNIFSIGTDFTFLSPSLKH